MLALSKHVWWAALTCVCPGVQLRMLAHVTPARVVCDDGACLASGQVASQSSTGAGLWVVRNNCISRAPSGSALDGHACTVRSNLQG